MSWQLVPLGNHIDLLSGFAFKSELFNSAGDGLPLVRIRDVISGKSETYYSGEYSQDFLLQNGDMLIGMDGDFNRAYWSGGKALLNQRVCKITAKKSTLDQSYLYHFLPKALAKIHAATPAVTVKHLSVNGIRAIEIPLPPLEEQKRIAAILDKADAIRRKRQQAIKLADEFLSSVFLDMFGNSNKTVVEPLGKVCDVKGGKRLPAGEDYVSEQTEHPYLRIVDFGNGSVISSQLKYISEFTYKKISRYTISSEDVYISIAGTIGLSGVVPEHLSGANLTENAAKLLIKDKTKLNNHFLAYWLTTPDAQSQIKSKTMFTSQPKLALFRIEEIMTPIPPIGDQEQFLNIKNMVQSVVEKMDKKNSEKLLLSLSQKFFSSNTTR